MTRPRRFGKTVTARMLAAFYSCGCDSRELFKGLKITSYKPKDEQQQNAEVSETDSVDFHGNSEDLTYSETGVLEEEIFESDASSGRAEQTGDRCCDNTERSMENHVAGNTCVEEAGAKEETLYEKYSKRI